MTSITGCVNTTFVPTGAPHPAKPADCDIEVYTSSRPDRPYEEIGMVEGEGDHWKASLEDLLPKLRQQACLAGGDALILFSTDTFAEGEGGARVQRVAATVIRWKPTV